MKIRKKVNPIPIPIPENEVRLCELFIDRARAEGFAVYPEVSGWDLVLVDTEGVQLGIQAKMRPNVDVLSQAIKRARAGPRYRGVLVPKSTRAFRHVAISLGLTVFSMKSIRPFRHHRMIHLEHMIEWKGEPLWLPPVPSQEKAGTPAPRPLTQWRVKAIRLCLLLEERGYLTGEDFKRFGVNQSGWLTRGELKRDGTIGRFARYVKGWAKLPIVGFEREAEQLRNMKGS